MEDIAIPMLHGNMEDISQESTLEASSIDGSSIATQQIYDRESRLVLILCVCTWLMRVGHKGH